MSGLTEAERTALVAHMWGRHVSTDVDKLTRMLLPAVERIIADREKALRESIAQEIEDEDSSFGIGEGSGGEYDKGVHQGLRDAARIARGGAR